jgi:hypothetical protein
MNSKKMLTCDLTPHKEGMMKFPQMNHYKCMSTYICSQGCCHHLYTSDGSTIQQESKFRAWAKLSFLKNPKNVIITVEYKPAPTQYKPQEAQSKPG